MGEAEAAPAFALGGLEAFEQVEEGDWGGGGGFGAVGEVGQNCGGVCVSGGVLTVEEGEGCIPVSGVQWSVDAVLGVRTPELGAAGAFVSWASSRAMVVVVVVVCLEVGCGVVVVRARNASVRI